MIEKLPLETQTLYAEMMEQLTAMEAQRSIGHASGCFTAKHIRGATYYYFQHSEPGGVLRQIYIGKKSPELDRMVERFHSEREASKVDAAQVQRLCAQLRAGGALTTDAASARVLKVFADSGVFHLDGVLLGTHAFTLFGNLLGVRWEKSAIRIQDVDNAGETRMRIALPNLQADIPKALESLEMGFVPVPALDPKNPSRSFKVRGQALRVDLLTPETSTRAKAPIFIPRFNVAAQPIRFLDYLIENPVKGAIVNGGGILVNVPQPARFALHKLILSKERELEAHDKAEKDVSQAAQLLFVLLKEREGDLLLAWDDIKQRGGRWVKRVVRGLSRINSSHHDIYQGVIDLLRI